MPGIQHKELAIPAGDQAHRRLGLRERADMILLASDVEHRAGDVGYINSPPPQLNLPLDQLVLLVELANPLAERGTWEWDAVVDPFVHGEPRIHGLILHDTVPHGGVGADVVGDRLEHAVARIDEVAGNVAERVDDAVGIEVLLAGPQSIQPDVVRREVYRRRE